jgi:hypothetical protein
LAKVSRGNDPLEELSRFISRPAEPFIYIPVREFLGTKILAGVDAVDVAVDVMAIETREDGRLRVKVNCPAAESSQNDYVFLRENGKWRRE